MGKSEFGVGPGARVTVSIEGDVPQEKRDAILAVVRESLHQHLWPAPPPAASHHAPPEDRVVPELADVFLALTPALRLVLSSWLARNVPAPAVAKGEARCPVNRNCQGCTQCEPAPVEAKGEADVCGNCRLPGCRWCKPAPAPADAQGEAPTLTSRYEPTRADYEAAIRLAEARGREAGLTDAVAVAKTLPWRGESAPEFANRIVAEIRALRPTPGAAKGGE